MTVMSIWRERTREPLAVTHHGRVEIINGIGLAGFRRDLTTEASFDEDFEEGRYIQADVPWRATLQRAADLSRRHTVALGCRSLDVLHVASALELQTRYFLTFNSRQQKLAQATGMKLVKLP